MNYPYQNCSETKLYLVVRNEQFYRQCVYMYIYKFSLLGQLAGQSDYKLFCLTCHDFLSNFVQAFCIGIRQKSKSLHVKDYTAFIKNACYYSALVTAAYHLERYGFVLCSSSQRHCAIYIHCLHGIMVAVIQDWRTVN